MRDTSDGWFSTPIGVKECSHGWSDVRRKADIAEPVVGKRFSRFRPERAEDRFHPLTPPPRRGGPIFFFHFHGFRFTAPVATFLRLSEAEKRLCLNCHGPVMHLLHETRLLCPWPMS